MPILLTSPLSLLIAGAAVAPQDVPQMAPAASAADRTHTDLPISVPPDYREVAIGFAPYRAATLLLKVGYADLEVRPGRWKVRGYSGGNVGGSANVAQYRGALLAKSEGFKHFAIVKGDVFGRVEFYTFVTGVSKLTMVGVPEGQSAACEEKGRNRDLCRLLDVDDTISRMAALLRRSPEEQERDLADARDAVRRKIR